MSLYTLALLALIQGITEFLPVSSSGHLILLPNLLGTEDQGLALDIAVHLGTLLAVIIYFWKDVRDLITGGIHTLFGRVKTDQARLFLLMVLATIPVIVLGFILKTTGLADAMRDIRVIGWAMLLFGIILYWADMKFETRRAAPNWSVKDAIVMGLWQALALIPGTSRSGATITASRILGFKREDGAKLAMLMSIPTILASGLLLGLDVLEDPGSAKIKEMLIAAGLSFAAALGALFLMMRLLRSVSYTPYVIYRIILGLIILTVAYT